MLRAGAAFGRSCLTVECWYCRVGYCGENSAVIQWSFSTPHFSSLKVPIRFACPHPGCHAEYSARDVDAGIEIVCNTCGRPMRVPDAPPPAPTAIPLADVGPPATIQPTTQPPVRYQKPNEDVSELWEDVVRPRRRRRRRERIESAPREGDHVQEYFRRRNAEEDASNTCCLVIVIAAFVMFVVPCVTGMIIAMLKNPQ